MKTMMRIGLGVALGASVLGLARQTHADASDPCTALTPAAIAAVISTIDESHTAALTDVSINGTSGEYPAAPGLNRDNVAAASTHMTTLQAWLEEHDLVAPYVSNTAAAYGVHNAVREAVWALHHARHWASISIAWHDDDTAARVSFDKTSEAIRLIEPLGEQAGRCYIKVY